MQTAILAGRPLLVSKVALHIAPVQSNVDSNSNDKEDGSPFVDANEEMSH